MVCNKTTSVARVRGLAYATPIIQTFSFYNLVKNRPKKTVITELLLLLMLVVVNL